MVDISTTFPPTNGILEVHHTIQDGMLPPPTQIIYIYIYICMHTERGKIWCTSRSAHNTLKMSAVDTNPRKSIEVRRLVAILS